eukprot:494419-Pleurochrysis_carterae.AAC.1
MRSQYYMTLQCTKSSLEPYSHGMSPFVLLSLTLSQVWCNVNPLSNRHIAHAVARRAVSYFTSIVPVWLHNHDGMSASQCIFHHAAASSDAACVSRAPAWAVDVPGSSTTQLSKSCWATAYASFYV